MRNELTEWIVRVAASAALMALHSAPLPASTLAIQVDNPHAGLVAARVGVASDCDSNIHVLLTNPLAPGAYTGCSSISTDAQLAAGVFTFTAGDRVKLRNGFSVDSGALLTIEIDRTLYPDAWVQDDTPEGESVYAARFYVDPSAMALTVSDRFYHFLAFDTDGQPEVRVGLKQNGPERRLFLEVFEDDGLPQTTEGSNELLLSAGWHWIDLQWQRGNGDGFALYCVDSVSPPLGCVPLSSLDNDTGAIDFVRWGAVDVPSSSDIGNLDLDDFESRSVLGGPPNFADGFESSSFGAWSTTSQAPPIVVTPACNVPSQRPTVQAAVNDPACARVVLAPGTYSENVIVARSVTLEGAGPASSMLTRPMRVLGAGTVLSLSGLAVSLTGCYPQTFEVMNGAAAEVGYGSNTVSLSNAAGPPGIACPLFADGFESNAVGAWSLAIP